MLLLSLKNGGIRNTFEARGYTAWDVSSPAFVVDTTLSYPHSSSSLIQVKRWITRPRCLKALAAVDKSCNGSPPAIRQRTLHVYIPIWMGNRNMVIGILHPLALISPVKVCITHAFTNPRPVVRQSRRTTVRSHHRRSFTLSCFIMKLGTVYLQARAAQKHRPHQRLGQRAR